MNESISEILQSVKFYKVRLMLPSIVITQSLLSKRAFDKRSFLASYLHSFMLPAVPTGGALTFDTDDVHLRTTFLPMLRF